MITWHAGSWSATYKAGGQVYILEVDSSHTTGSVTWNWRVIDATGEIVRDGSRKTAGQAKTSCTRAAKAAPHRSNA